MAIVESMLEQIAPIGAEERLHLISDMAVATGSAKKETARSHQRSLQRQAEQVRQASAADLEAIGIHVVKG